MLRTNRGFWKFFFLSLITFGIYDLYYIHRMAKEANMVDTSIKKVPGLIGLILLSIITLGIYELVWNYRVNEKFAAAVRRGGTVPKFDGGKWLLWTLVGALIVVGPLVALVKMIHLWNDANKVYNAEQAAASQPAQA